MRKEITLPLALILFFAAGIISVSAENMNTKAADETILVDENVNSASTNPAMTTTGTAINPDNNIYPGGRTRNGITPNPVDATNNNSAVKIRRLDDANSLSSDSKVYFRGEVVSVDRNANQIVVRDNSGATGFYVVKDRSTLNELQQGDQVEIFR